MIRVAGRKRLQLVNSETNEVLIDEMWTPYGQAYLDGFMDGQQNTLGKRAVTQSKD